jgi:hypothetical protein
LQTSHVSWRLMLLIAALIDTAAVGAGAAAAQFGIRYLLLVLVRKDWFRFLSKDWQVTMRCIGKVR